LGRRLVGCFSRHQSEKGSVPMRRGGKKGVRKLGVTYHNRRRKAPTRGGSRVCFDDPVLRHGARGYELKQFVERTIPPGRRTKDLNRNRPPRADGATSISNTCFAGWPACTSGGQKKRPFSLRVFSRHPDKKKETGGQSKPPSLCPQKGTSKPILDEDKKGNRSVVHQHED